MKSAAPQPFIVFFFFFFDFRFNKHNYEAKKKSLVMKDRKNIWLHLRIWLFAKMKECVFILKDFF